MVLYEHKLVSYTVDRKWSAYTFLQVGTFHISCLDSRNCHPVKREVVPVQPVSSPKLQAAVELECIVATQHCRSDS